MTRLERRNFTADVSRVAEHESWRKEVHLPPTYVHKWWARRLGTVFRRLLLDAADATDGPAASRALAGMIVYDPFAGSGTTLVEAVKLGARVVGRDINPIATLTQRQALARWNDVNLKYLFGKVADGVRADIDALFVTAAGETVLHYFWVAVADCPTCAEPVELFSTYVFAKHTYPARQPIAHATCPECHAVCPVNLGIETEGYCAVCDCGFALTGPVKTRTMTCRNGHRSLVTAALGGKEPRRAMYAKMVKLDSGRRVYRSIDQFDLDLYDHASKLLADTPVSDLVLPDGVLKHGESTRQALLWGFKTWASFFNDRQLYCLGRLAATLRAIPGRGPEREALVAAFSKTLEHHNVFCSYKGEGTGPVRSVFHNHVLRPERCSVEGNPWGAEGGSGGYADALSKLLRTRDYKLAPTDLLEAGGQVVTVTGRSRSLQQTLVKSWQAFTDVEHSAYIITGDAARTDLPDRCVDLVMTDPPYVDNVHYSELADFFHAWMTKVRPYTGYPTRASTRHPAEVQNRSESEFETMISAVWAECARVLRDDGLVVFSFHQSKTSGWAALMSSLAIGGLTVTATRPVVAEVTTSLTKFAAAEPNRIDVVVVCRKTAVRRLAGVVGSRGSRANTPAPSTLGEVKAASRRARRSALDGLSRLRAAGITLGAGDVRSAVRASVLALGTQRPSPDWRELSMIADAQAEAAVAIFCGGVLGSLNAVPRVTKRA